MYKYETHVHTSETSACACANGAARVTNYTAPMGAGMDFNYGARPVDEAVLEAVYEIFKDHYKDILTFED